MAVPLHQHSHYSIFDGYATIDEILDRVKEIGSDAVALTDHGTVAGHVEFYRKATERGIKPILGIESYQARDDRKIHHKSDLKGNRPENDRSHLIVIAYNNKGLNNLWTISTRAYLEGFYHKPRVDWELLQEHNEGLILTSACLGGKVSSAIMKEQDPEAVLDQYLNIFGERFFIELHTYDSDTQRQVNGELVRLGQKKGVPFVYATDAHYACADQYCNHEAFVNMSMRKKASESDRNHPPSLWILDEQGIRDALSYLPKSVVEESISNTHMIADMSEVELPTKRKRIPTWGPEGTDRFVALVEKGYFDKVSDLDDDGRYMARVEKEMSAILEADLVDFFLIEHLVNDYAETSGVVRGPGRGSVGGSLVAYLLGITDIDPIQYGLIFERFYNKGREKGGLPDIDTDFAIEDRDKIKQFMRDTFGEDCVTHIGTVMKLHGKSAIERVGKYLEVPIRDIEEIKAIIDSTTDAGLMADWDDVMEVGELQGWIAKYPDLFSLAGDLHGRIFASSVHASGFVVGDEPLAAICPLRIDKSAGKKEGEIATQFDMHEIESLGFMKLDFLALKNLSILKEAQGLIKRDYGVDLDFKKMHHELDLVDKPFWELLDRGLTVGVFQVEDGGIAKKIASRMKCRSVEDLAVLVALNRPGPLRAGYVDMYLDRRESGGEFDVLHSFIADIVEDTYGVFVYQEQVISLFTKMGFTLEEADDVRRIMGKKKVKEMEEFYPRYMNKAKDHMDEKSANELWQELLGFSKYAFNKAHSVAYGIVTLWTLWTKYLYPAEYLLACIRKEDKREDVPRFIAEAQRMGTKVNAPDINKSMYETDIIDGEIYLGLKDVKGVSKGAEWVIENRPFENFDNMIEVLESQNKQFLIDKKAGNVDGPSPKQRLGANKAKALFNAGAFDASEDRMISKRERREFEKELLGIILTNDAPKILDKYKEAIEEECSDYSDLRSVNGKHIVAGEIKSVRRTKTKKGQDMAWITMEYGDQTVEFAAFEQQLLAFSDILEECIPVLAVLKVTNRGINLVSLEELS
jgi:DNA polymerase-3 subunit alpha